MAASQIHWAPQHNAPFLVALSQLAQSRPPSATFGEDYTQMSQITQPDVPDEVGISDAAVRVVTPEMQGLPLAPWDRQDEVILPMSQITQPDVDEEVFDADAKVWRVMPTMPLTQEYPQRMLDHVKWPEDKHPASGAGRTQVWTRAPDGKLYCYPQFAEFYGERDAGRVWNQCVVQSGMWRSSRAHTLHPPQRILCDPPPQMLAPLLKMRALDAAFVPELRRHVSHDVWEGLQELLVMKCYDWGAGHAVQVVCDYPASVLDLLRQWAGLNQLAIEVLPLCMKTPATAWSVYIRNTGFEEHIDSWPL